MTDRVFASAGEWAVASDGVQWILQRRYAKGAWRNVAFVRSARNVLARCTRENGVPVSDARFLLAGLPDTFDQWKALSDPVVAELTANQVADG